MIINDLFNVACSSLYISSCDVTNVYWTDPQSTDKNHNRLGRTKFKQSEETACPFVFQPLIRVWVMEVRLLPLREAHRAPGTILLSQFHQDVWGKSQGGLRPAERSHASSMSYMDARQLWATALTPDANACFQCTSDFEWMLLASSWTTACPGFGVPPPQRCPNNSEVSCCEVRPIQNFLALKVIPFIVTWKCSDCSSSPVMSRSLWYISCVWGLRVETWTW